MKILTTLLALMTLGIMTQASFGKSAPYAVYEKLLAPGASNACNLCVYNVHTHQIIWHKQIVGPVFIHWTKHHSALAMITLPDVGDTGPLQKWSRPPRGYGASLNNRSHPAWGRIEMLFWHMGQQKPRIYKTWFPPKDLVYDGIMEMQWSPDANLLSFRTFASGSADGNDGNLYCCSAKTGSVKRVGENVGPNRWVSRRCLVFRHIVEKLSPDIGDYVSMPSEKLYRWSWHF